MIIGHVEPHFQVVAACGCAQPRYLCKIGARRCGPLDFACSAVDVAADERCAVACIHAQDRP